VQKGVLVVLAVGGAPSSSAVDSEAAKPSSTADNKSEKATGKKKKGK
jgi:hypothetical protein